ncbi:MAG TPA: macro domain-containing protein [Tepidisphaeraceae bacterium]|jgi:O-acetyl-ADP-ribose deacetylase (regulator of RNase III)
MRWAVKAGDILDEPVDVLVCSANVFLNLSGGVGGAILLRYGDPMQRELHETLARRGKRFAQRGDLVVTSPCGTPYKAVIHAVAVDGFYQSSPEVVRGLIEASLERAAAMRARRVALTALATGHGRMSMRDFAGAIEPLVGREWPPIEEVVICVRNSSDTGIIAGECCLLDG